MNQTKKLHELIDLAKKGLKFEASLISENAEEIYYDGDFLCPDDFWTTSEVTDDWRFEERKQPLKLDAVVRWVGSDYALYPSWTNGVDLKKFEGKKTRMILEEIYE